MTPSILFATPCYGGQVHAKFFASALNLKQELNAVDLAHDWLIRWNESLVHRARMGMAAEFLKTDHTHLFWIDADIEFTPEDIAAIWNMDADIGVGVYAMKKKEGDYFAAWRGGKLIRDLDQFNCPIDVDYAGTGFMCIKRKVIEEVYQHLRERNLAVRLLLAKLPDGLRRERRGMIDEIISAFAADYESPEGRVPAAFMTPIYNDCLESEDYHFCRIARDAGFTIMMDPSVRLPHWGQAAYGTF